MAYCINCGASNPAGAVFCLACGQTLYQEPQTAASTAPKKAARWLLPVGVTVGGLVLVLIIVLVSVPKGRLLGSKATGPNAPSTAAVLTIIGYDAAGNQEDQGSGFILTSEGLAVTNYHVLDGAASATAECCSGRKFEVASIKGLDAEKDLVVFQLHELGQTGLPSDLPNLALDSSGNISVGEKVIAIGSPQGFENTVSDGIISAIRTDQSTRYLQVTAPISPGSSGGPILNDNGQVIGIATMQATEGQNLNFAISSEYLKPLLDEHLQYSLQQIQPASRSRQGSTDMTANNVGEANGQQGEEIGPFTGQFAGTVHNDTADVSARFAIFIEDSDGGLSGCLAVLSPLGGSGPIAGSESGPDVSFVATSTGEKITFTGERTKDSITGTYVVEKETGSEEEGKFYAKRTKILDDSSQLDFSNCPTDADLQSSR
ncbi:MAG: trypsin-like peptidase domain-containing protein [Terracidiphilus sp.]|jgi:S1-C subfamily serine protease